jgi:prophage regulatory protein
MRILRNRETKEITGLSLSTRLRLEREGLFPQRIRIGKRICGWREDEIQIWINSREKANQ